MTHVTCTLTAKNLDQLGNRVWATFTFTFSMPSTDVLAAQYTAVAPVIAGEDTRTCKLLIDV